MALPILGVLVLPFVWRTLAGSGSGARLDLIGAALVAATSGGIVLLVQSPTSGVAVAGLGGLLVALGGPLLMLQVKHRPHGFLPMSVVRNVTIMRSAAAASSVPASWFALLVGVPAVLVGAGWEPWEVGLLLVPSAAVALVMPRWTGSLLNRLGGVCTLAVSTVVSAASLLVCAVGTELVSPVPVAMAVVFTTIAFGLGQPALTATVGDAVHVDIRGVALGVATLLFLVGGSVGSAVVAGLGEVVGIPGSLAILAALPLLGLLVLMPELRHPDRSTR